MYTGRRSEIEIIAEILMLSEKGIRKTEILYQANLSYKQLSSYLSILLEKDFLKENKLQNHNSNGTYMLYSRTEKGHELLTKINKILSLLRNDDL